jgi:hypothetical protein
VRDDLAQKTQFLVRDVGFLSVLANSQLPPCFLEGPWNASRLKERTGQPQMIRLILAMLRILSRACLEIVMGVLILIAFSPALVGMGIIGFQFFVWLVTESWPPIPLADALEVLDVDLRSIDHLQQVWEGLASIVRFWLYAIPLSSCFLLAGLILSGCMAYIRWSLLDIFEQIQ